MSDQNLYGPTKRQGFVEGLCPAILGEVMSDGLEIRNKRDRAGKRHAKGAWRNFSSTDLKWKKGFYF